MLAHYQCHSEARSSYRILSDGIPDITQATDMLFLLEYQSNKRVVWCAMTRNLVGPIPEPDELYGRTELLENLWQQIAGNNILLLAPRRFGKSGVMRHVLLRPQKGFFPLYLEVEDVDTPEELLWRITRQLLSHDLGRSILSRATKLPATVADWFKNTFDEVEFEGTKVSFRQSVKEHWREIGSRLLLEMEKTDGTVIFIFDELPSMLEKMRERTGDTTTRDFLAWFRKIRLEQKDVLRRHRFVVAGSIGIDTILRQLNSPDKLNDFQRIYVGPLAESDARTMAHDLAETLSVGWGTELCNTMLGLIGPPVPFFIHLMFSQLAQLPESRRGSLSGSDLETVYRNHLLGAACKSYFDHYSTRLRRLGKQTEKAAVAVLRTVAGAARGRVSRSVLFDVYKKARGKGASDMEFDELLADLETDWYLVLEPGTNEFRFMLNIMQDWWRRWYPAPVGGSRKGQQP